MEAAINFPFFSIMLTMAAGIISNVLKPKTAYRFNLVITTICFILNAILLYFLIIEPKDITFMMGHFPAPWGNEIRFGPFEALMSTCLTLIVLLSSISQSDTILKRLDQSKGHIFYLMVNLLLSSTYALIFTNDIFTAYVFIEINTLCSIGLVAAKNSRKCMAATIKYLIMSLLGSGLFLISISLLYAVTGHLLMPNVHEVLVSYIANGEHILTITIIGGLLAISIAIKSALFPFHNWVPNAYDRAFNFTNSLSSGIVLKSYIILLIKMIYRVFGMEVMKGLDVLNILFIFGSISLVFASYNALKEIDEKIKREV